MNNTRNTDKNSKSNISTSDPGLSISLNTAATDGKHEELVKLIKKGSIFQPVGPIGMNPLHSAAENGHLEVCKILLKSNVLIDTTNMVEKTALHLASVNGHSDIVDLLLSAGASVDVCDMFQMTPLHWVCDRGHSQVAYMLLRHGANPDKPNKYYKTPRSIAMEKNYCDIVELMKVGTNGVPAHDYSEVKKDIFRSHSNSSDSSDSSEIPSIFSEESIPISSSEEITSSEEIHNCDEDLESLLNRSCDLNSDEDDTDDKLLKSMEELESCSFDNCNIGNLEMAATELLRVQAALLIDDPLRELKMAISLGQTIKLTEAGKIALSMIRPDPFIIPTEDKSKRKERENNKTDQVKEKSECNTVALCNQTISELYNELTESCNLQVPSCRSPTKRYKR